MNPLNNLVLGLMGAVIIVVIYYLVKLLMVDPARFDALKSTEIQVKIEKPDQEEEEFLPAE
jgi:hypothetical protein